MLRQWSAVTALLLCATVAGTADVLELKDQAAVTGKIIAEKADLVVVDLGYTVLTIPRKDIVKISGTDSASMPAPPAAPPTSPRSPT